MSGDYAIGYTAKGESFYFDKEDYDLISKYCWHRHTDGYIRTSTGSRKDSTGNRHNNYIMIHQLLSLKYDFGDEPDHINGKPFDNRKENLRKATHAQNMKNVKLPTNNTSGHKGVHYSKIENKWKAYITCDGDKIHLGTFQNKEEAIKVREDAEAKYFKEFNRDAMNL